ALEELELVKGCVAVAGKPGMRAAMNKPTIAVELALDSRPDESNDKVIARGGANVYVFHDNDLSICPASAGHFFVFQNCCYRASQSCPRRGFTLGENAFEPFAGNPPGMGRAEAIAPTARAAPNLHALLRDTEQLRDLTCGIVVELE